MRLFRLWHPFIAITFILTSACSGPQKESATLLIYGGTIYTVDSTRATVEAIAQGRS